MEKTETFLIPDDVDYAKLSEMVCVVAADDTFKILELSIDRLGGGTVGRIYHCHGLGRGTADESKRTFNIIMKKIKRWKRFGDPESWNREMMLYNSGFFNALPDSMKTPKCYDIVEGSDEDIYIWLEYISGMTGDSLERSDYDAPAYNLGQFHALLNSPPGYTWLSSRFIPMIYAIQWGTSSIDWLNNTGRQVVPDDIYERIMSVWNSRDEYMKALLKLPSTLCHRDYYYQNIFVNHENDGTKTTIVIDWDTTGIGVLAEDIADFTLEAIFDYQVNVKDATELKEELLKNYLKGLTDNGWNGNPVEITLGYSITVTLHWLFRALYRLPGQNDDNSKQYFIDIIKFCLSEAESVKSSF